MTEILTMGSSDTNDMMTKEESHDDHGPSPPKIKRSSESATWQPKVPFLSSPIYDLRQCGDVIFGPGTRSQLLGILGGSLPRLSSDQHDTVTRAKKYAMEQSIKMVLMKQTLAHQQQSFLNKFPQQLATQRTQVQRTQALALMCRVYVGSISFELKEDTIRAAFLPFGPIKSINMSWDPVTQKHKGFAFVEYEIPEGAQLALEQMNGAMLGGRNIKVGRPSNMPQAQQVIDEIQEEAKSYNRIYIASIHPDLTEEDIKSVFEAFGPIIFCKLSQGSTPNSHKGYGFIEYSTNQAALESISSMNLFDLGGQLLRVGRSITPPNALMVPQVLGSSSMPTAAAVAAAAATAKIQAMDAVATNVLGLSPNLAGLASLTSPGSLISQLAPTTTQIAGIIPPPGIVVPTTVAVLQPPQVISAPILATTAASLLATPVVPSPPASALLSNAAMVAQQNPTVAAILAAQQQQQQQQQQQSAEDLFKKAQEKQQEELQKKLLEEGEPQTLQQQESISIKGTNARHLVMQRLMRPRESRVVILRNMVGPEDVDETLQEEIQDECSKFGQVDRVIIYKEKQSDNEDDDFAEIIVKIFVEFSMSSESEKARNALNGRYFAGRQVRAEVYDQALFEHGDLSG